MSSKDCRRIVSSLIECDLDEEMIKPRTRYQRLWNINSGWQEHAQVIINELEGSDEPYDLSSFLDTIRKTRSLILQYALQQYYLENDALPETLDDLVPEYLPHLVEDPVCEAPFEYELTWEGYTLSSSCEADPNQAHKFYGPAAPYAWQQFGKKLSKDWWRKLGEKISNMGAQ